MPIIKVATLQDIPAIHQLAHRIWPTAFKNILSPEQIAYMLDWMYNPAALKKQMESGHRFLLVSEKYEHYGYCAYEHQGRQTFLHKIYVVPDVQGTGLGKSLVTEVLERARENGSTDVLLHVNRYNRAVTFYEKLGFVILGTEDNAIGGGYYMNDYLMCCTL